MSNKFQYLCSEAFELALKSDMKYYLCAFVLSKGKIVSKGVNSNMRQRVKGYATPSLHSEMSAVSKLSSNNFNNPIMQYSNNCKNINKYSCNAKAI